MSGNIDTLTLVALIVAIVVVLRLRSVLGRRTGDEETRVERSRAQQRERQSAEGAGNDKVVALPRRDRETTTPQPAATTVASVDSDARIKAFAGGDINLAKGLAEITKADQAFDPENFVRGARQAYEMIVTAFAEGNRRMLKDLLSRDVYEGFVSAIDERERRGEQLDQSFVGINKSDILEAEMKKGVAYITIRFVSQLISATRDKAGVIVDGDPQKVSEVTDIWTFARDLSTSQSRSNPNWRLDATQSSN